MIRRTIVDFGIVSQKCVSISMGRTALKINQLNRTCWATKKGRSSGLFYSNAFDHVTKNHFRSLFLNTNKKKSIAKWGSMTSSFLFIPNSIRNRSSKNAMSFQKHRIDYSTNQIYQNIKGTKLDAKLHSCYSTTPFDLDTKWIVWFYEESNTNQKRNLSIFWNCIMSLVRSITNSCLGISKFKPIHGFWHRITL